MPLPPVSAYVAPPAWNAFRVLCLGPSHLSLGAQQRRHFLPPQSQFGCLFFSEDPRPITQLITLDYSYSNGCFPLG